MLFLKRFWGFDHAFLIQGTEEYMLYTGREYCYNGAAKFTQFLQANESPEIKEKPTQMGLHTIFWNSLSLHLSFRKSTNSSWTSHAKQEHQW